MEKCRVFLFLALLLWACSKGEVIEQQQPQKEYIPLEALIFELNGEVVKTNSKDTLILQEEGARSLKFLGYEPSNASVEGIQIDSINFYRDIYTFNYAGDSVIIREDKATIAPDNHYICFVEGSFENLCKGVSQMQGEQIKFYNYVNRNEDFTTVLAGNEEKRVQWEEDLGKFRQYRLEFIVKGEREQKFYLPFYEGINGVEAVMEFVSEEGNPCVKIAPGDTLQLEFKKKAPQEFTQFEWCKGEATERFNQLNAKSVGEAWERKIENPLLTEEGMRYLNSKLHLTPQGKLFLDADFTVQGAQSAGGAFFTTIPISLILMPAGSPQSNTMGRSFTFPSGVMLSLFPTPIYCNCTVEIII